MRISSILRDQQYMFGVKKSLIIVDMVECCGRGRTWSPCCFDDRCNDRNGQFSHAV